MSYIEVMKLPMEEVNPYCTKKNSSDNKLNSSEMVLILNEISLFCSLFIVMQFFPTFFRIMPRIINQLCGSYKAIFLFIFYPSNFY